MEINQNWSNKSSNWASIIFVDADDKLILNDSITVFINGIEQKVGRRTGGDYSDTGYYFSDVPIKDKYIVEVKLTNKKKYVLGKIDALPEQNEKNIELNENGDYNKDVIIVWKDIKIAQEMRVRMSTLTKIKDTKGAISFKHNSGDEKVVKIRSEGSFTVSKQYYFKPDAITTNVSFEFKGTATGTTNPNLLKGSEIFITTYTNKYTAFEVDKLPSSYKESLRVQASEQCH